MKRLRGRGEGGILTLAGDDSERELDFELSYLRSVTTQERFALMFRRSPTLAHSLVRHGHHRSAGVFKRS